MGSLLSTPPIDLRAATVRLTELKRNSAGVLWLSTALAAGAAAVWAVAGAIPGISLLAGSIAALALAAIYHGDRRRLLLALVAQGDASGLRDVAELASELCSPTERRRLASSLRHTAHAGRAGTVTAIMVDPARASDAAPRLLSLAAALEDTSTDVEPSAIALCRRMLVEAARSPLYNPRLPAADLGRLLELVEHGIRAPRT